MIASKNTHTKWALVTGATFGIGEELSILLAKRGFNLILVARTQSKLDVLAQQWTQKFGVQVQTIAMDLTTATAASNVYSEVKKRGLPVEVLVNNAGFGSLVPFLNDTAANLEQMIQLNVTALTQLTHSFAKDMSASGTRGYILNVASIAGFMPGPMMAVYYATKAYVLSFSEAIHEEFGGKVRVTTLCPGPTPTQFQERAGIDASIGFGLMALASTSATKVAKEGIAALFSGKAVVIPGFFNKSMAFLVRLTPRFLVPKIVMAIQKKRS